MSALIRLAENIGEEPILLKSVLEINDLQPLKIVSFWIKKNRRPGGETYCSSGVAFKNDTDDVRESRAIPVILELEAKGASLQPSIQKLMIQCELY